MGELDAATAGRLRVRSPDGVVHGGGLLLTGTTAVTCAHVVTAALRGGPSEAPRAGPPRGHVLVERPAESGRPGASETAEVTDGGWFVGPLSIEDRVNPAFRTDFAVLTLSRPFPHGTRTALPGRCPASDGRTLAVFGYPKQAPHGLWVSARLVGAGGPCPVWRQLDVVADSGVGVEQGFSGSGVWDPRSRRMVGLVTAAFSRGGARIAWMLPLDAAADQWATLYAHFDAEPGGRGAVEGGGTGGGMDEGRGDEASGAFADGAGAWPPAVPPVLLPPPSVPSIHEQFALAKALLAIPQVDEDNGAALRGLLPPAIRHNVRSQSRAHLQVAEIVRACTQHRDGRAALREAIVLLDPESVAAGTAVHLLDRLWAVGDGA
ncbi:trypsin-like peptidase domain-containing protein [Streptomyces sp. NPDC102365]|uniref:effector-associated domain 2-containing protein n=1 Tax=Streptomyces sp. NPDC102365 TaxID=3366162 RepID=UPI0037FF5CCC